MSSQNNHSHETGAMNKDIFGFWVYILTDVFLFTGLFATFAVLANNYYDGPSAKDIFSLKFVFIETIILLVSSFIFGMASLARKQGNLKNVIICLVLTLLFGFIFLFMEVYEFSELIVEGYGPDRSAFLSAFFALVGTHGLHVTFGSIWMVVLIFQLMKNGFNYQNDRRLSCLGLFWHFLDIIWIFVFTIVYLMGAL